MNDSPQTQRLREKHNYETLAAELGDQRAKVEDDLITNTRAITDLMPKALEAGIPLDTFAQLVRVSRQTLYRWRESD